VVNFTSQPLYPQERTLVPIEQEAWLTCIKVLFVSAVSMFRVLFYPEDETADSSAMLVPIYKKHRPVILI
jgi:hypothetical protein